MDHGNRYLARCSKEDVLSIIIVGNISFAANNYTTFGFSHDLLNFGNSVKIISGKPHRQSFLSSPNNKAQILDISSIRLISEQPKVAKRYRF